MNKRDLIIIGGGAGGLVVASVASQLGLKVSLIEKEDKLGGDCLHYGCVPSKTLIRSAGVASLMRRGADFGLPAFDPEVDMRSINARVRAVIERIQPHDDPERFRAYGCEVLFGEARFVDAHRIEVAGQIRSGKRLVIATGSRPLIPDIPGLEDNGYLTNIDLFSLPALPTRLLILGGGPIGLEMAQAFARLGSRVTVLERLSRLLPQEEPEVAAALTTRLQQEGIEVVTGVEVERISRRGERRLLHCHNGHMIEGEQILVATGRQPNCDNLGLENAGVTVTARGIPVDRRQRTSRKHIYALGDVCGPWPFTHMAEYQAGIVISNAVFRLPRKSNYRVVPRVIYTEPELARVGLSEQQAREQGLAVQVLRFNFSDIDRALCEGETDGLYKLITHRGRILGATLLGPHAGELIHELALAMQANIRIGQLSGTIHAYPTLSQIHRRAVNTAYAPRLFSQGTRKLVRWIHRYF